MSPANTSPTRGQPKIRDFMAHISNSVESIRIRLVGDESLGSSGLVQEVDQVKKDQRKTAEVLLGVAEALKVLEAHRVTQIALNEQQAKIIEQVKAVRYYFAAACFIVPAIGGIVGWAIRNDIFKRLP